MEITTTEFFKNMKSLPPKGSEEFVQLVKWEEEKCLGGVTVNGVKIPGWLYFHLNHWWIRKDSKDQFKNITKKVQLPDLRDNEWIRSDALEECRLALSGYMEVGLRQGGKSEFEASITGYNALLFKDTQNVIVGGNDSDLSLLKDKIDFGLKNMWEGLAIPRIDKDWRRPMVKLGYKTKGNEDDIWSYLIIRNAQDGNNTEAAAGTTAKSFVMDEVGKYPFGQVFVAAKEAFISEFGWRTIPILVGTGGSFDNGADAERFFNNPDANNFLAFVDPTTGKRTCLFMSGLYRQDCKFEMSLDQWLMREGKLEMGEYPELAKIPIKVADKEKALEVITKERETKKRDPDKVEYLKTIMYHPLTPEECFMSNANNVYNRDACKAQKGRLDSMGPQGVPVELYHDGEKIMHKFTNKIPISSFPMKNNEDRNAPVVIYEFPIEKPPFGLYVAGVDPYRQGQAKYSNSLGVVYIFKRIHDIQSEKFQYMIVASYAARPDDKSTWEEQARFLIKMYNARALVENDDISFIEYMKAQGDAQYLEKQPDWLRDIVPGTSVNREYGIHRSSDKIRDHLRSCLKRYTEEVIFRETDEKGSVIREVLGVSRIFDPMLLEEMAQFNEDGNFDREVAASITIAMANHLDPIVGKISTLDTDPRLKSYFNKNKTVTKSPVSLAPSSSFTYSKQSRLFKRK